MTDLLLQRLPALGIDVGIPATWAVADADHADVLYLADEQEGYRTTVALTADELDPPTPARFEELIAGIPEALAARYDDLEVLGHARFVQAGLPAWFIRYRWRSDQATSIEQLLAFVIIDPDAGKVVQVDASTISPLAEEHLPLVRAILETIRPAADNDDESE